MLSSCTVNKHGYSNREIKQFQKQEAERVSQGHLPPNFKPFLKPRNYEIRFYEFREPARLEK